MKYLNMYAIIDIMTTVLLTSKGLTPAKTASRFSNLKHIMNIQTCGLVYNAADSPDSKYIILAQQQLTKAGLQVTLLDARDMNHDKYDVLYIAGGDTQKLLNDIRSGIGTNTFKQVALSSRLIIGVSAGAVLLTPTIRITTEINPDEVDLELSDYSGLGLLDYEFLPHYSEELKVELADYKKRYNVQVVTCADEEYIETIL